MKVKVDWHKYLTEEPDYEALRLKQRKIGEKLARRMYDGFRGLFDCGTVDGNFSDDRNVCVGSV